MRSHITWGWRDDLAWFLLNLGGAGQGREGAEGGASLRRGPRGVCLRFGHGHSLCHWLFLCIKVVVSGILVHVLLVQIQQNN